jgi:hypothetical protein
MWARHRADISSTQDLDRWWDRISSKELSKNGVACVLTEQDKLISFKVVSLLKTKGETARYESLRALFSLDREVHIEDTMLQVHDSIAVLVDFATWTEIDSIVEAGQQAIQDLEHADCVDLKTVVAFRTFPAGKEIIQRGKLFLQKVPPGLPLFSFPPLSAFAVSATCLRPSCNRLLAAVAPAARSCKGNCGSGGADRRFVWHSSMFAWQVRAVDADLGTLQGATKTVLDSIEKHVAAAGAP